MKRNATNTGYSLLEIAIVLMVIGLLIFGITAGRNMLQNTRLRNMASEIQQLQDNIQLFRLRYHAWPGDVLTASRSFQAHCAFIDPIPCDGNGDRMVDYATEGALAWYHLAGAGLVSGTFSGEFSTGQRGMLGENMPRSPIKDVGYYLAYNTVAQQHFLGIGGESVSSKPDSPTLPCKSAHLLDSWLDDGLPNQGRLVMDQAAKDTCIHANEYNIGSDDTVSLRLWLEP